MNVGLALTGAVGAALLLYFVIDHASTNSDIVEFNANTPSDVNASRKQPVQSVNAGSQVSAASLAGSSLRAVSAAPFEPFSNVYARASASDAADALELRATILLTCLQAERDKDKRLPSSLLANSARHTNVSEQSKLAKERLRSMSSSRRCANFELPHDANAVALALMRRAAELGGHTARVFLLEEALNQTFEPIPILGLPKDLEAFLEPIGSVGRLSPDQFGILIDAFKSGEPEAILAATPTLFGWFRDSEVVIAGMPGNVLIDDAVIYPFAEILACRLGGVCGEDSEHLIAECANKGACNYRSVEEFHFAHVRDADRRVAIEHLLTKFEDAYRTGDWSFLELRTNAATRPKPGAAFRPLPRFPRISV